MYACTCGLFPSGRGLPGLYSSVAPRLPFCAMLASFEEPPMRRISKPLPVYPRTASLSSLQSLIMEDNPPNNNINQSGAMLTDARAPEGSAQPVTSATSDGLLILALQERLNNQLRSNNQSSFNSMNININGDATSRLWQSLMLGIPLVPQLPNPLDLNYLQTGNITHPLWHHSLCVWPECNQPCETLAVFLAHLSQAHTSDDRATADIRKQVETVDTLEHRLTKERNKLQAMMQHLQMKHSPDTTTPSVGKIEPTSPMRSPKTEILSQPQPQAAPSVAMPTSAPPAPIQITTSAPLLIGESSSAPMSQPDPSPPAEQKPFVPRRSRISDKTVLPISADIARNREFYRTNDVRPPYTYASLIRQAIMESPECQLTLNEIYTWFTDTFAYFRRNAATWKSNDAVKKNAASWKNAVRHNLSLHKCFQRVEQNVKGAVWTVDDSEFYRRRPQRSAATRSQPNTPMPDDVRPNTLTMTQQLLDHTTLSMLDGASKRHEPTSSHDGILLAGGLEGVLTMLASQAGHDQNPLALLSAAAAASEHSSARGTPSFLKEERIDVEDCSQYNGIVDSRDPDATPPASGADDADVSTTRPS